MKTEEKGLRNCNKYISANIFFLLRCFVVYNVWIYNSSSFNIALPISFGVFAFVLRDLVLYLAHFFRSLGKLWEALFIIFFYGIDLIYNSLEVYNQIAIFSFSLLL